MILNIRPEHKQVVETLVQHNLITTNDAKTIMRDLVQLTDDEREKMLKQVIKSSGRIAKKAI